MFRPRFRQQKRGGRPVAPAARASGILKHFFWGGGGGGGKEKSLPGSFFSLSPPPTSQEGNDYFLRRFPELIKRKRRNKKELLQLSDYFVCLSSWMMRLKGRKEERWESDFLCATGREKTILLVRQRRFSRSVHQLFHATLVVCT